MKLILSVLFSAFSFFLTPVLACTDIQLSARDGTILVSRSMEFGLDLQSNLRTSPRGRSFSDTTPHEKAALSWKSKYGYLYLDALGMDAAVDGINEQGLSIEALYLPGETGYQAVPINHDKHALAYYRLGDWVLGNFKTVEEVRNALFHIYVYAKAIPKLENIVFPLHFSIFDASGKGIVVEYVAGKINIYDNTVHILTNVPQFPWHIANLRNYVHLSPYYQDSVKVGNVTFTATGQGAAALGLPGDYSPPARFVKMSFLSTTARPTNNAKDLVNLAQHILNTVDIPRGAIRPQQDDKSPMPDDLTQWVIFKDLTHKILYYRFYDDLTLRSVDMAKLDFSEKAIPLKMPIKAPPLVLDMTEIFIKQKT